MNIDLLCWIIVLSVLVGGAAIAAFACITIAGRVAQKEEKENEE